MKAGYAELHQYASSTGSGEIKSFKRLTEQGEVFGVNKASMGHPFKTEARFYGEAFPQLLGIVMSQLTAEVPISADRLAVTRRDRESANQSVG